MEPVRSPELSALVQLLEREIENNSESQVITIIAFEFFNVECYLEAFKQLKRRGGGQECTVIEKVVDAVLDVTIFIAFNPLLPTRTHLVSELRNMGIPGYDSSFEPPNGSDIQPTYELGMAKYFENALHLCQEVVDMENFNCENDRWVMEWFLRVVLSPLSLQLWHTIFVRLQSFKDCLIWFFSWWEEWESALDFIWRLIGLTPDLPVSHYFSELGQLFVAVGVSEDDAKTLTTAADLLRTSSQFHVTRLEFECASKSYGEAVKAAMLSRDFSKGESILIESLEISDLRDANAHFLWRNETKGSLWEFLFLVAHGYQTGNKFQEAVDLLTRGLTLARQVGNEERRKYLEVEIEWELGEVLCGSHRHLESILQEGVQHWIIALEILGKNAPDAALDDSSLAEWTRLMRKVRRSLGNWFAQHQRFKEAYYEYMALSRLHSIESKHELKHHLLAKAVAAFVQFLSGEREEGFLAYEEVLAVAKTDADLQGDIGFQAEMLTRYSLLLGEHGDKVKSREVLDVARSFVCKLSDLPRDQVHCVSMPMMLYKCLVDKDISSAFEFVQLVDPAISDARDTSRWSHWNRRMAGFYMQMKIDEEAQKRMELYLDVARAQKCTTQSQPETDTIDINELLKTFGEDFGEGRVVHKLDPAERFEILLEKMEVSTDEEKKQKLLVKAKTFAQKEWGDASIRVGRASARLAWSYRAHGLLELAEEENAVAMRIFKDAEGEYASNILGVCYVNEALRMALKRHFDEAEQWMEKAKPFVKDEHLWKSVSGSIKLLWVAPESGEKLAKEVVDSFVTQQSQFTPAMDSLWIQNLEEFIAWYKWLELCALDKNNCLKALIWVERSRSRLFMRISADQAGASRTTMLDFDGSDAEAEDMIKTCLEKCGRNVAVVEFSYTGDEDGSGTLLIYVIYLLEGKLVVKTIRICLLDQLKDKWKKNLAAFVHSVLSAIERKEPDDKQAKAYMGYLHDLLCIRYIMDHVVPSDCDTLVFAPHGHLSLLPLHALYDNSKGEYLIQQIRVCYVPSLRMLSHCLEFQERHKTSRRSKPSERAFVAGNPYPMGCNMRTLPNAEKEAEKVAEILSVQPCVREEMTKEAVKQGLCGSSIVLLATHADPGRIVLQGVDHQHDTTDKNIRNDTKKDETLTANEISKLPVRAALVVLDGCETGKGELKSEGLLGLGRSVLLAGASTVVLSLWKVNDATTSDIVAGMFQNAIDEPRTVAESLRVPMLNMLTVKNIYYWAPLIVVGSPTLCIKDLIAKIDEEMVDTVSSSSTSTPSHTIQRTINWQELDETNVSPISTQAPNYIVENSRSFPGLTPLEHTGVMCDGCNTEPIIGSRFRAYARYKENYDLCERCFSGSTCTLDQFERLDVPNLAPPVGIDCIRESCMRSGQCLCKTCGSYVIMS